MSISKLAFPEWVMGQVLLPEQFEAQQQAMLAHLRSAIRLRGLPAHGLARLVVDEVLLGSGALRVEALTYLFPSGLLVDVPGNAVVNNLNLRENASTSASIFLHVDNARTDAADLKDYLDDPGGLQRVIHRVELSLAARSDGARESVKLLGLVHRGGRWELDVYAPPLLNLGGAASPFLRSTLDRTARAIEAILAQLQRRIRDAFLGAEQSVELRRVRAAAERVLARLGDHGVGSSEREQQVACHPYVLYAALRDFYIDASLLREGDGELQRLRYRHEDLAACFEELRRRIEASLGAESLSQNRLEFERRANWFVAGPFPAALRDVRDVFLVVKSEAGTTVNLEGVKLASPRRIEEVYTKALAGVPIAPFQSSAFAHIYGQGASFYRIQAADNAEWAQALKDGDLCFPAWRELEGVSAVLVWGV